MAQQTINIGNLVNDGLGDDLRTAFQKVNTNFSDLYSTLEITAENIGATGVGIFAQKSGSTLQFKNLVAGSKISLVGSTDNIIVSSTAEEAFTSVHTDAGVVNAASNTTMTIQGGDSVNVTASGSVITVDTNINLTQALQTVDFGYLTGTFDNTVQFLLSQANIDFGEISSIPSSNINLDLGSI